MRYILVLSLFYNLIDHNVDGAKLLLRSAFQQVVDILSQFAFVQCAFHEVASFVDLVFLCDPGESVAKLPPAGSLLGLSSSYHEAGGKYSPM
jgi:hypothetical protein